MRVTIVVFTALVLAYAIAMKGTSIYDLVSDRLPGHPGRRLRAAGDGPVLEARHHAGRDLLGGRRASRVWMLFFPQVGGEELSKAFPGQLAGLIAAFAGMIAGSLAPQVLREPPGARASTHGGLDAPSEGRKAGRGLNSGPPPIIEGFAPARPS